MERSVLVKNIGGLISESWVGLKKIIYPPSNGVKISEVKFSEACLVSENLTLLKISRYMVPSSLLFTSRWIMVLHNYCVLTQ